MEALKKKDADSIAQLNAELSVNDVLNDPVEDELEDLLDEIGNIEAPTFRPTQRPPLSNKIMLVEKAERLAPSSCSSDLYEEDEIATLNPVLSRPPPLPTFQPTIQTNSRPVVGISQLEAAEMETSRNSAPGVSDSIPFPIAPESFSAELYLRNHLVISQRFDCNGRIQLSAIPQMDNFSKVPLVVAAVISIEQPVGRDFSLNLADESGQYYATMHEQVTRESRIRPHYGMFLILADCSIFRPCAKSQCLVIVPRNVRQVLSNVFSV